MHNIIARLAHDERGASAVEYGLILSLIFLAMAGALSSLSDENTGMWNTVSEKTATASAKARGDG